MRNTLRLTLFLLTVLFLTAQAPQTGGPPAGQKPPMRLADMTWPEVQLYLTTCDMVLIPVGSTEQHGLHLPLGTDTLEAGALAAEISRRSGVVMAPVMPFGISSYHAGFPGTISLSEETLERVLREMADSLVQHGFRKFLFFNYHGGNKIVIEKVVHHLNHHSAATAVILGIGSTITHDEPIVFFDWHAGIQETSLMLALHPEQVRMELARKPKITFTQEMERLRQASEKNAALDVVLQTCFTTDATTGKGGSSRELSDTGVWCLDDPAKATATYGRQCLKTIVESSVDFIHAWQALK